MKEGAESDAKIIGPQDGREDAVPKVQVKKSDGEEPCGNPKASCEAVMLDFYLFPRWSNMFFFRGRFHTIFP